MNFLPLLAVLFIGLKLTNHIDWSWWWVLAPLWAPLGVIAGTAVIGLLVVAVASVGKALGKGAR